MANLICAKCNQQIDEENMVECPHCWEIYHKECWEDTENCFTCKRLNPIYALVQAQKEDEEKALNEKTELQDKENIISEETDEPEAKIPSFDIANAILLASNVLLVVGIVMGVALGVYLAFEDKLAREVAGIAIGAGVCAVGWVASVLVKGIAELVNNSQRNSHYLSKLLKNKEKDSENNG